MVLHELITANVAKNGAYVAITLSTHQIRILWRANIDHILNW